MKTILLLLTGSVLAGTLEGQASPTIAIVGATLIDGTGAPARPNATIVVRGGRIIAVDVGIAAPKAARIIPAAGRWVIPGMIDTHVHFSESARPGGQPTLLADLTRWFPWEQEVAWMKARARVTLSRYLCSGVTSVAALGAIRWESDLRDLAESGARVPRVLVAGGPVAIGSRPNPLPQWEGEDTGYTVQSAQGVSPLLDLLSQKGIDLVKISIPVRGRPSSENLQRQLRDIAPTLTEIVRESHARGYRVAADAVHYWQRRLRSKPESMSLPTPSWTAPSTMPSFVSPENAAQ